MGDHDTFSEKYPALATTLFTIGAIGGGLFMAAPLVYVLRMWWAWWLP
jgi:hypothetical protein